MMEKLLEEISFNANDMLERYVRIDAEYVDKYLAALAKQTDLSKFIL
jgi:ATP-dependent HslUV protease ATP-binding subunit HslU